MAYNPSLFGMTTWKIWSINREYGVLPRPRRLAQSGALLFLGSMIVALWFNVQQFLMSFTLGRISGGPG
ncbi:hypothetical protein RSAG8_10170, partial [Rhizoctonia solani AG-8 WAC10335]